MERLHRSNLRNYFGVLAFMILALSCASEAPSIHELLDTQTNQASQQALDRYVIRPLDTVDVQVWKEPDFSGQHLVRKDGKITMPLMGDVMAAGLNTSQLAEAIHTKLKTYIEFPEVSVSLVSTQPSQIYVSGEVAKPGEYEIREGARIVQAITMAGGLTEWAKRSKIILIRVINGKEMRFMVDYSAIVSGKDPKQNVQLRAGDAIIVQ